MIVSVPENDVPHACQVALRPVLEGLVLLEDLLVLSGGRCREEGAVRGRRSRQECERTKSVQAETQAGRNTSINRSNPANQHENGRRGYRS